jgi:hypothetical protein
MLSSGPRSHSSHSKAIPAKTAAFSSNTRSSNTRRRTILNDFVIRVVASITNQSRRVETMAASLCPAGTRLVPGLGVESAASPISTNRTLDTKLNGRILSSVVGTKAQATA